MPRFTLIAGIMPVFAYAYFAVPEGTPFRWKKITIVTLKAIWPRFKAMESLQKLL